MSSSKPLTALTLALGVLWILRLEGQVAVEIAGPWEGAIQVGATSLRMRVVFTETPAELGAVIDIPQQGASGLPLAAVARTGSNIHFELPTPAARAVFDGRIAGNAISGTFAQGQVSGTFELTRLAPVDNAQRPPYVEHEVAVTNGPVRLAGTLTVPQGAAPFPLVVMITGSGPQNRDEDILGFKIFQVIADRLARQGIAVYRYDDRGVGGSTGNLASATTPDFAGDALAALAALKSRSEVDAKRIGMLGHSEGATVAAIAASRSADVSFVVLLAPPGARGEDMLRQQAVDGARGLGADAAAVARVEAAHTNATSLVVKKASAEEISSAVKDLVRAQVRHHAGRAAASARRSRSVRRTGLRTGGRAAPVAVDAFHDRFRPCGTLARGSRVRFSRCSGGSICRCPPVSTSRRCGRRSQATGPRRSPS